MQYLIDAGSRHAWACTWRGILALLLGLGFSPLVAAQTSTACPDLGATIDHRGTDGTHATSCDAGSSGSDDGSAVATLEIPASDTSATITLAAVDSTGDPAERVIRAVASSSAHAVGSPASANGTVIKGGGDPCDAISFPYTLPDNLPETLIQAIACANADGAADVIDLNAQTVTLTASFSNVAGTNIGLPEITTPMTIRNGTITRSSADLFRFFFNSSSLDLNNITVSNADSQGDGGAIYNGPAAVLNLSGSRVIGNYGNYGGAIFNSNTGTTTLTNTLVAGNRSNNQGGGIRNRGTLTLNNSTIAGNLSTSGAEGGGGIASAGTFVLALNNSLVFGNESPTFPAANNVFGAFTSNNSLVGVNPSFVAPLDASDTAPTTGGDYRLGNVSVAVDAGDNSLVPGGITVDLDGNPRRVNDTGVADTGVGTAPIVDIGAYEKQTNSGPFPTLSINDASIVEGNTGVSTLSFTVTRTGSTTSAVGFSFATVDGTATAGSDYVAVSGGTGSIPAGGATGSTQVSVTISGDAVVEPNETFSVVLSAPVNATIASGTATGMITNDDVGGITLSETDGSTAVTEGGATDTYTLALTSQPTANVSIALTPGAQVTATTSPVVFTPATWNVAQTVTVTAVDDAVVEGPHTGSIAHVVTSADATYNNLSLANVVASITDNDTAGVSITQSSGSTAVSESGTTDTYTIVLDSQPSATVLLAIAFPANELTVNGDTDGTYNTSFTTGNWNTAQTITVAAVNDRNFEGDHTGALVHSFVSADPIYTGITAQLDGTTATNTLTANIADNETVELRWVNASGSDTEGATYIQNVVMDITADPVGGTPQNDVEISFQAPITFITAAAADIQIQFIAQTISAGNNDGQQYSVFHDFVDDSLVEGPEAFSMAINVTTPYPGLTVGTNHTATILEGSTVTASIATTGLTVGEDIGTFSIPVTLNVSPNAALSEPATVVVQLNNDTALFNGTTGDMYFDNGGTPANSIVVTFPAGSDNGDVVNAVVTIVDDQTVEGSPASPAPFNVNERFGVTLGATTGVLSAAAGTTTVALDENDFAYITVDTPTTTVDESDGTITRNLRVRMVTFGAGPQQLQGAATVPLQNQTFGSAAAPGDYTLITPSVTIPAGALNDSLHPFQVSIVDDGIDEPSEFGDVAIVTGSYSGVPILVPPSASNNCDTTVNPGLTPSPCRNRMTIQIVDNDEAGIVVTESGGNTAVTEGGATDSYTVVLGSQPAADVTINIAFDAAQLAVNGDSDGTTSLTFSPSDWNTAQTVNVVAVEDTLVEANPHSSLIVLTSSSADALYNAVSPADVNVSITDNDTAEVIFSSAGFAAIEGAVFSPGMTLKVTANGAPGGSIAAPIVVDLGFAPLTASAADVSITTAQATFPAGSTHDTVVMTHSITVVDDPVVEGVEDFELDLSIASGFATTTASNTYTIIDNDSATVSFAPIAVSQSEAITPMAFTVTLSNPVASGVTLTLNSTNGTASAADFTAISGGSVTFPSDSTAAQTVNVVINNDALDEDDESFTLALSNLVAAGAVTLGTATATGTIEDDDALPVLSVANVTQPEGDAVNTLAFTVNLSAVSGRAVSFTRATADGTAISTGPNADFVALAAGPLTIPAGETSVTLPVTINGDTVFEGDESFSLNLTSVNNASPGTLSATATLQDDDQEATTTEITSDEPDPSAVNAPYTVQVIVRGQTLAPTGTVTVDDGTGASCGPLTLVAGTPPASSASCPITSTTPGIKTLTASYTPDSTAFAASSDTEPHTVVVVAPEIAYAPTTGTTVDLTGVTTIGTTGSGTIVATPSGGADTGPGATTTIDSCSLGGSSPGSFAGAAAISLSFVGNTTTPQNLALTCSAAATIQTATLTCSETRGSDAPVPRAWPLSCPAGALLPLTSTPAVGGTVSITGTAGGGTATRPITLSNPNPIEVSLTCAAPGFPFTATPLVFSIPANGSASVSVGMSGATPGNYSGILSCTVAGSPQVLTFNLAGSLVPVLAVSATSHWSLIVLMLGLFGFAAVAVRRKA